MEAKYILATILYINLRKYILEEIEIKINYVFLVINVLAKVINIIVYIYIICIKCISMSLVDEFTRSGSIFCRFFKMNLQNSSTVCFNDFFLITNSVAVTMSIYISHSTMEIRRSSPFTID